MLGAIIGDIVGSRFEFNPTNDYDFELFTDKCGYTDDTICTIAVADALLKGKDLGKNLHEWCNHYPCAMGGYGGRFARWVRSRNPKPYGSFGNGSAMRVSPVAWYHSYDKSCMLYFAAMSAACTHNHEEGLKGAMAVAYAIYDCRGYFRGKLPQDADKETIMKGLQRAIEFSGYDINIRKKDVINKFDETCQGTVPVAFWIISNSHNFEDAIRKAVSLGADADTLGAIVGSIAEAIWGIPKWMKHKAMSYLPKKMQQVVKEFRRNVHGKFPDFNHDDDHFLIRRLTLALGNRFTFEDKSMPTKDIVATADSWYITPMPDNTYEVSNIKCYIEVSDKDMKTLRKGHIPDSQGDNWFMYCDDKHIRYYRSWTGICIFEANYHKITDDKYLIDSLTVNNSISKFGVNGNIPFQMLFIYLITTETGYDENKAWMNFSSALTFDAIAFDK